MNAVFLLYEPDEPMQFRCSLPRILHHILSVAPALGPAFIPKVDLDNAYMHV